MNDLRSYAKKFENEIKIKTLKIDIKVSMIKIIKSSNDVLKKSRRNNELKKRRVETNALTIEMRSFVKKFRDDVTNENEISNKNEISNENLVILIF